MHDVLFTPYVSVKVDDDGTVKSVEIDWSDTLRNDYRGDVEVWSEGDDIEPPTAKAASAYLDADVTRERVLAAFQPPIENDDLGTKATVARLQLLANDADGNKAKFKDAGDDSSAMHYAGMRDGLLRAISVVEGRG